MVVILLFILLPALQVKSPTIVAYQGQSLDDDEMKRVLARFRTYGKQSPEIGSGDAHAVDAPERRG